MHLSLSPHINSSICWTRVLSFVDPQLPTASLRRRIEMSHHPSRSDPTHLQSGLTRALDQLGRTRGSSATPAPTANIVSPTPQRGYLDMQIAKMSAIAASGGDGRDLSSGSSQSISSRAQGQGQFQSPRSAGVMSSNQRSPYQSQSSGCDMTSGQYRGGGSSSSTVSKPTLGSFSSHWLHTDGQLGQCYD